MKISKGNGVFLLSLILVSFILVPKVFAGETGESPFLKKRRNALKDVFKKEMITVADGVYVAVGYGASNPTMIVGKDGVIIVDTMLSTEAAGLVLGEFRKIAKKPIKAIILTHSHSDHTSGTKIFYKGSKSQIWARQTTGKRLSGYDKLGDILSIRAVRQFGSYLSQKEKIDGLAPVYRPLGGRGGGKMKPTHILNESRKKLTIAGVDLELVAAPGETDDHLYVWLPGKKVLICGDNFYSSFPNLYAIRGTQYRDSSTWISTLDKIIKKGAEHLISGHARPISGKEKITRMLGNYRDAIKHILEQTLAGMNKGLSPVQLAHTVQLPPSLADKKYLQEYYGVISWTVRAIYNGYVGWFDGNPTNLFPLAPVEEAKRMVKMAGSRESMLSKVQEAIGKNDYQWACQLTDYLLVLEPEDQVVKTLKAKALLALADLQVSSNARNYYLTVAKELLGEINMDED